MKTYMIHPAFSASVSVARRTLGALALASSLLLSAGLRASVTPVVSTTFTIGSSFADEGWVASYDTAGAAAVWEIKTVSQLGGAAVAAFVQPNANNPKTSATLTKAFDAFDFDGQALSLTFNAGWLYGTTSYTASGFHVALLDDDGNGYVFRNRRSTGNAYSAGWAKITDGNIYLSGSAFNGVATSFDTSQVSISASGSEGFPTFTITRSALGLWSFSAPQWPTALTFSDSTFSTFTRIVFYTNSGFDNSISLFLNNVTLTATSSIPEPGTATLTLGLTGLVFVASLWTGRRRQ